MRTITQEEFTQLIEDEFGVAYDTEEFNSLSKGEERYLYYNEQYDNFFLAIQPDFPAVGFFRMDELKWEDTFNEAIEEL